MPSPKPNYSSVLQPLQAHLAEEVMSYRAANQNFQVNLEGQMLSLNCEAKICTGEYVLVSGYFNEQPIEFYVARDKVETAMDYYQLIDIPHDQLLTSLLINRLLVSFFKGHTLFDIREAEVSDINQALIEVQPVDNSLALLMPVNHFETFKTLLEPLIEDTQILTAPVNLLSKTRCQVRLCLGRTLCLPEDLDSLSKGDLVGFVPYTSFQDAIVDGKRLIWRQGTMYAHKMSSEQAEVCVFGPQRVMSFTSLTELVDTPLVLEEEYPAFMYDPKIKERRPVQLIQYMKQPYVEILS